MTFEYPSEPDLGNSAETAKRAATQLQKTRRWFSWVLCLGIPFIAVLVSIFVSLMFLLVVSLAVMSAEKGSMNTVMNEMQQKPWLLLIMIIPGQLSFLCFGFVPALFSAERWRSRLAMGSGHVHPIFWGVLALATPFIGLALELLLTRLGIQPSQTLQELLEMISAYPSVWILILLIGVMPGICEEVLFRGYVQSRLLKISSPYVAIGISSFLFALAHIDPMHAALVFPIGIWLGIVAWRCGSIWPTILGHFVNNTFNVIQLKSTTIMPNEELATPMLLTIFGVIMAVAMYVLIRTPRPRQDRELLSIA